LADLLKFSLLIPTTS